MTGLVRAEWTKLFTTRVWIGLLLGACAVGRWLRRAAHRARRQRAERPAAAPAGRPTPEFEQLALRDRRQRRRAAADPRHHRDDPGVPAPHRDADVPHHAAPRARGGREADRLRRWPRSRSRWSSPAVNVLVVEIYAGARGAAPSLDRRQPAGPGWRRPALVIYAVIGVGVGALLRNQVGAIVGALVYLSSSSRSSRAIPAHRARLQVAARRRAAGDDRAFQGPRRPPALAGRLLLLGYGLLAALLGTLLAVRRDVDLSQSRARRPRTTAREREPP